MIRNLISHRNEWNKLGNYRRNHGIQYKREGRIVTRSNFNDYFISDGIGISNSIVSSSSILTSSLNIKLSSLNHHSNANSRLFSLSTTKKEEKNNNQVNNNEKKESIPQLQSNWINNSKIGAYYRLARLDKPIGTWLLLLPCFWGLGMATLPGHLPDPKLMALFSSGALVMRGAGCTINDLWDRNIDKKVERTKNRPLANGELTVPEAIRFLALQLSVGLGVLLCFNPYSIAVGASSLAFVVAYPLMKRITYWPQAFLGLTFNWGALVGYSSVGGFINWPVVLPLYAAGVAWTLVYDTIYAFMDKEDDKLVGVKSTALRFANNPFAWLSFFSATSLGLFAASGWMAGMGWPFYLVGIVGGGMHYLWQLKTVDLTSRADCMRKFVSNKWLGLIFFLAILVGQYTRDEDDQQSKHSSNKS